MSGTQLNPWEQNNPWTEVARLKAENERLETELALAKEAARKTQEYNEEIIENVRAQLVEARERIKEMEADEAIKIIQEENARLKEQVSASIANTNVFIELAKAFHDLPDSPIPIVEIAIRARDEIGSLRAERDKLQERSNILLRQIDIKRDELRRADQDHIALQQEQNAAMRALMEAKPPSTTAITGLAQYACQVRDCMAELRQRLERAEQSDQNNNIAYTILREAFPNQPRRVGLDTLIVLARAAVDRIAELKAQLAEANTRAKNLEQGVGWLVEVVFPQAETNPTPDPDGWIAQARRVGRIRNEITDKAEAQLAEAQEAAKAGRLHAMQTINRLQDELAAARQVCEVADAWEKIAAALASHPQAGMDRAGLLMQASCAHAAMRDAVRAYRKQTNNQQPQGDKTMPTPEMIAEQRAAADAQGDFEDGMKRRLAAILEERPATAERMASDDSDIRSQDAPSCAQVDQEGHSKPDPAPLPTPATEPRQERPEWATPIPPEPATEPAPSAQWPITPKTAPAGARILVKHCGSRYEDPHEITIHEWAPSGKRVLFYDRYGKQYWDEDLPARGILVETLPPSPERQIARTLAKDLMEHLIGVVAERDQQEPAGLDTLLKDKPGAATTLDHLDELAAKQKGDAER